MGSKGCEICSRLAKAGFAWAGRPAGRDMEKLMGKGRQRHEPPRIERLRRGKLSTHLVVNVNLAHLRLHLLLHLAFQPLRILLFQDRRAYLFDPRGRDKLW